MLIYEKDEIILFFKNEKLIREFLAKIMLSNMPFESGNRLCLYYEKENKKNFIYEFYKFLDTIQNKKDLINEWELKEVFDFVKTNKYNLDFLDKELTDFVFELYKDYDKKFV